MASSELPVYRIVDIKTREPLNDDLGAPMEFETHDEASDALAGLPTEARKQMGVIELKHYVPEPEGA